jgi:ABC-type phosphate transport system substrate-binding protein
MKKLLIIKIIALMIGLSSISYAQIVIVVNKSNPLNEISINELKQIFLAQRTSFQNGKSIELAEYAKSKPKFYDQLFGWTVLKIKKHWMGLIFSGMHSSTPKEFKLASELIEYIQNNDGVIGFMDLSEVDKRVKTLLINGKSVNNRDYPLQ